MFIALIFTQSATAILPDQEELIRAVEMNDISKVQALVVGNCELTNALEDFSIASRYNYGQRKIT